MGDCIMTDQCLRILLLSLFFGLADASIGNFTKYDGASIIDIYTEWQSLDKMPPVTDTGVSDSHSDYKTPSTTTFTMKYGSDKQLPRIELSIDGRAPHEFVFRGFAYASTPNCCPVAQKDVGVYMKALYEPFIKRMAGLGANALRVYDVPIDLTKKDGPCEAPPPQEGKCNLPTCVTREDVRGFLDYCLEQKIFVLLDGAATQKADRDSAFYEFLGSEFGAHPAFAGAIMFDENYDHDPDVFNAASHALLSGICKALDKPCTPAHPEQVGKIITTAFCGAVVSEDMQRKYGEYVNTWGFDPYYLKEYSNIANFQGLPQKPYLITENGVNGAMNMGCRTDCASDSDCTSCQSFKDNFKSFIKWTMTAKIAGHFLFEFSDEAWKANPELVPCESYKTWPGGQAAPFWENNHGIFSMHGSYPNCSIAAKQLDSEGTTFETVLKDFWLQQLSPDATYGYRGWASPPSTPTPRPTPSPGPHPELGSWKTFDPEDGCTFEAGGSYPKDKCPKLPADVTVKRFAGNNYFSPMNVVGASFLTELEVTACFDCMQRCFLGFYGPCYGITWSKQGLNSDGTPTGICMYYSSISALAMPAGGDIGPEYVVFNDSGNLPKPEADGIFVIPKVV